MNIRELLKEGQQLLQSSSSSALLDAQLLLNQARTNYITALYDYNIGIATLEKAMGIPAVIHTK